MKRIVIKTERPDAFHLMAKWLQKIFPECEVCILDLTLDAENPSQDDVLIDRHGFQNKGVADGKNFNHR